MTDFSSDRVLRVPGMLYGDLEAAVIRHTGFEPEDAQRVVDAVLGPMKLAPAPEWNREEYPCGHAFWSAEGEWEFCVEEEPHDRHENAEADHWRSGNPRDVDLREFGHDH